MRSERLNAKVEGNSLMKIAVPKECRRGELRVAVSPEVVKKLIGFGFSVAVEKGAGIGTSFTDAAYKKAGARIAPVRPRLTVAPTWYSKSRRQSPVNWQP